MGTHAAGPWYRDGRAISRFRAPPAAAEILGTCIGNAVRRSNRTDATSLLLGYDQITDGVPAAICLSGHGSEIHLQTIRVDIVGLVVQPQRGCIAGAQEDVGLVDVDCE